MRTKKDWRTVDTCPLCKKHFNSGLRGVLMHIGKYHRELTKMQRKRILGISNQEIYDSRVLRGTSEV